MSEDGVVPQSRDERHDSIDPQTGGLTTEAVGRRQEIMGVLRGWGHQIGGWADAVLHPHFEHAVAADAAEPGDAPPEVDHG